MRLFRLHLLPLALVAMAACHDDAVSVNARPPLAGVRFINAVPDGGAVDIRMVDQVEWSANSVNGTNFGLAFRAGTIHWPTEAKDRHIRVFPNDSSIAVTTQVLHDTVITIEPNVNMTLMLVGSRAAGGKISFVKIYDDPPTLTGQQIAVRLVNASSTGSVPAAADGYIGSSSTASLPGVKTFANVAPRTPSPYVVRDTGSFAMMATAAGTTTPVWAADAPAGAPAAPGIGATAGALGAGSALSAYLFPRSVAGTAAPQSSAFTAPAIVWFVDLIPPPAR